MAGLIVGLLILGALATATNADAPGQNVFAGNWTTTRPGLTHTGTMDFRVTDEASGSQNLQSFGGQPCQAGAVYYFATYTDPGNGTGLIYGCETSPGHMVARYKDGPTGVTGDFTLTFSPPASFNGINDGQYPINGTFAGHFAGDGCCPSAGGTTGTTGTTGGTTGTTGTTGATTGTTGSTTGTTGSTTGGGTIPSTDGPAAAADCAAGAAAFERSLTVAPKPTFCAISKKKNGPAVLSPEKEASSVETNRNVALLVVLCLFVDPHNTSSLCQVLTEIADYLTTVFEDPPSNAFTHAFIAQTRPAGLNNAAILCPAGCPAATGALNAFVGALQRLRAALAGLANAANRYSGARLAGSAGGMILQAGLAAAYAGETADAMTYVSSRTTLLSTALAGAGQTTLITTAQIQQVTTELQTGLPAAYARRLPPGGAAATSLAGQVKAVAASTTAGVPVSQALAPLPVTAPAAFKTAQHTITLPELSGVIDALRGQHALSKRNRNILHADVVALTRAANQTQQTRALSKLKRDIANLARNTGVNTVALLTRAAAGL